MPNTFLYVGIDVSKNSNQLCALNFNQDKLLSFSSQNNLLGATVIESKLLKVLRDNVFSDLVVFLESTGIYSFHIATFLSASEYLSGFNCKVFCINPKNSMNFRKTYSDMDKTDPNDSFILADMARVGRWKALTPVKGTQKLAIQRLSRHRKHLSELIAKEKTYVLNNVFLKFSAFSSHAVFSDNFGATATAVLEEFASPEDIVNSSLDELIDFVSSKSNNRFNNPSDIAILLQKCARDSYRLDKCAYSPINSAISSSLACIRCFEKELKAVNNELANLMKGFNSDEYTCILSIPGIGNVFAAGILSEIGSISQFDSDDALAKYAGITWRTTQSGNFSADVTPLTKTGNAYLRYYLIEAADSVRRHNCEYAEFYSKKYNEVTTHQHHRALVLTARKLVRLIYGLLSKNQLYKHN